MTRSLMEKLLRRVAARERLARLGVRSHRFLLVIAAAYLVLLLVSRLAGLLPDWFAPETILLAPAAAFALAFFTTRTPSETEAARLVDRRTGTDDLFLTAALLDRSPGRLYRSSYGPIVESDAEKKAAGIRPADVVPFRPGPKARDALLALGALLLGVLVLPQLDPFGRARERTREAERRKRLEDGIKSTAVRSKTLKEKSSGPEAAEVDRALEELGKTFRSMKPGQKKTNLNRLGLMQKQLGRLWRKTCEKALRRSPLSQRFGSRLASKWKEELGEGKTNSFRKELARLKEKLRRLAETADPAERDRLRNEVRQGIRRMAEFAEAGANSRDLGNALARAMEQLGLAGMKGLSQEALQALEKTLDLTGMELASLAKHIRELQRLEDALSAAQLAKSLCNMGELDGAACTECQAMSDYAAFYRNLLEGMCRGGGGPGMRGPGVGRGGEAPEDPGAETDFRPQLSRTDVTAGKMLLEWKTKGLSDPGRARESYRRAIREIKQGWSEAVLREQVPPGYRAAIRKYFDSIEEAGVDETGSKGTKEDAGADEPAVE